MMQGFFKSFTKKDNERLGYRLPQTREYRRLSVGLSAALLAMVCATSSFAQFSSQSTNPAANLGGASGMSGATTQVPGTAGAGVVGGFKAPATSQGVVIRNQIGPYPPMQQNQRQQAQPLPPILLEPEPPTEFQVLTETTTGKMLPLFGRDLFSQLPSSFAPVEGMPVTTD